jgi:hypothetical protein
MPPYSMFNKVWLKSILDGSSKLLHNSEVNHVIVKHYPEIAINKVYEDALKLDKMHLYFPKCFPKNRFCDSRYFWIVFHSLHKEIV